MQHLIQDLLLKFAKEGAPVQFVTPVWSLEPVAQTLLHGPHHSAMLFEQFGIIKMAEMIYQCHWVVLPYKLVQNLPGLRIGC